MSEIVPRLFVWLQHLLPKYWLTALVRRLARIRIVAVKDFLIRRLVGLYDIDTGELTHPVPDGYPTLNAFFTRELAPGARAIDPAADSIVSPVDGTVSAAGSLDGSRIIQAKGIDYTLTDLLAVDTAEADAYTDGAFATLYLAPYNYHRVHAPIDGELLSLHYVPGDLYSVNDKTVRALGGLAKWPFLQI